MKPAIALRRLGHIHPRLKNELAAAGALGFQVHRAVRRVYHLALAPAPGQTPFRQNAAPQLAPVTALFSKPGAFAFAVRHADFPLPVKRLHGVKRAVLAFGNGAAVIHEDKAVNGGPVRGLRFGL